MSMLAVTSQPRGHKSMPPEFKTPVWSGPAMGAMRLMNAQGMVQSHGGPVWPNLVPYQWSGVRGMAGLAAWPNLMPHQWGGERGLGGMVDNGDGTFSYVSEDPVPVTDPVVTVPPPSDVVSSQDLSWMDSLPTPSLSPVQNAALEKTIGTSIYQTAPAGSNNPAPAGMEWANVLNSANQGILKVLVASKPGAYYQQLPNGFILSGGGNAIGGGVLSTPLGSASLTGSLGSMMPLLIGGLVLMMVMGGRR